MLTEDQVEGAFILYFTCIYMLLMAGALLFALHKKKLMKALGALIFFSACVGAIKFMTVLDWMYPVLKYLP